MKTSERMILLLLAAIQFTHIIDFMIMMPMGPQLMRELSIGPDRFSWLVAAYSIAAGVVGLLAAPFIDRYDRRTLLMCAYIGFVAATLLCGIAPNATALLLGRALGGAFGGVSGSLCLTIVSDVVPPERRAHGIGIIMTAFAVAAALGVPTGLFLAHHFSWRAPFLAVCGVGVIVWLLIPRVLPQLRAHLSQGGDRTKAFFELLRDANAGRALVFMISLVFGHFTIIPLLSPYLVGNVGLAEANLPLLYLVGGVLTVFTAPRIGRLADLHGRQKVFTALVIVACGVILAITNARPMPLWGVLTLSGLFFIFSSGRFTPGQAIITLAVPASRRGAFMSLSSCSRDLASGLSTSIGGYVVLSDGHGRLLHYNWLGWIAVGATLVSTWLARRVRVNDMGLPSVIPKTGNQAGELPKEKLAAS